ncbi:hypothetical protein BOX24_06095 [Leptospirillum ferriphilum]|uniref:Dyp-type peroxidase C-terminal domain-containing protein n=1 Tax=Leptospirillum ferriphilum TaxID=178606 RepID=A0A1V3SW33_9BACT|nr:hypothetical protein BOX24_06095 [Leptospirillum ferriphilum]
MALLDREEGLAGSHIMAVQRWEHDLTHFWSRSSEEQDTLLGRDRTTNEERPEAPSSAHIRETPGRTFPRQRTCFADRLGPG